VTTPLDAQQSALLDADGPTRYRHWLERCAATGLVWGLQGEDGWALVGDEDGKVHFPVWPDAAFASACAMDDWSAYAPQSIPLAEFLGALLPNLAEQEWGLAVFPGPEGRGVHLTSDELRRDLEDEMTRQP